MIISKETTKQAKNNRPEMQLRFGLDQRFSNSEPQGLARCATFAFRKFTTCVLHYSLFSGIYKIGYDGHLEVVRYPTLQLLQPYPWHRTLFLACYFSTWVESETNEVTNSAYWFRLPMQSAPVRFLIGLGYATRSKEVRTTGLDPANLVAIERFEHKFHSCLVAETSAGYEIQQNEFYFNFCNSKMSNNSLFNYNGNSQSK